MAQITPIQTWTHKSSAFAAEFESKTTENNRTGEQLERASRFKAHRNNQTVTILPKNIPPETKPKESKAVSIEFGEKNGNIVAQVRISCVISIKPQHEIGVSEENIQHITDAVCAFVEEANKSNFKGELIKLQTALASHSL